jgi:hypothetical protein
MQETLQSPQTNSDKPAISATRIVPLAAVLVALAVGLWFAFGPAGGRRASPPPSDTANLKMTPVDEEYVKNVQIENVALSRAENFIHQEVTILNAEVYNSGKQAVAGLRVTMTFSDEMNQIALRETRSIFGAQEKPLGPGERRSFEISFDHIPNSWNMQQPTVVVSYLEISRQ